MVRKGERDFVFDPDCMCKIPLWVKFPGLPVGYWSSDALSKVASVVRELLHTDKFTSEYDKISYARVLVNSNVFKPLPRSIEMHTLTGVLHQSVSYDWRPTFCNHCIQFGHDSESCWRNEKKAQDEEEFKALKRRRKRRRGKQPPVQEWHIRPATNNAPTIVQNELIDNDAPNQADNIPIVNPTSGNGNTNTKGVVSKRKESSVVAAQPPTQERLQASVQTMLTDNTYGVITTEAASTSEKNKVDLFGCFETTVNVSKAQRIIQKVARDWNYCCNYPLGLNGRVCLLWKRHLRVQILQIHEQFIHCLVEDPAAQFSTLLVRAQIHTAWLLSGDFNNILSTDDNISQPVIQAKIQGFQDLVIGLQLTPLRAKGCFFTWNNKQAVDTRVYSKIDWGLGNYHWLQEYGNVWKYSEQGDPMHAIWQKLKHLKVELKDLNTQMASYALRLTQARQQLEYVQAATVIQPLCQSLFDQEKELLRTIEKWSLVEEKISSSKNAITKIYNDNGLKLTDPHEVKAEFVKFFTELMGSRITREEIANAIKDTPNEKAPGVDVFPIEFFTSQWRERMSIRMCCTFSKLGK
ncbi:uncharacterized protein LOC132608034 [Lycium barbarum]|uniref:uncharacterized protein LOC132608034 n=1 Tax=Lycium barbarum TaxID=112863 RepID=UPI00293F4431|nr:uncharacterized protein LOC132608034 [Lycium barbarum]